jgi:RNA polymerase sigma-70 factor (sigma-E family)
MGRAEEAVFASFVGERGDHYLRLAIALTGQRHAGEDLLQSTLERVLRRLRRPEVLRDLDAYVRRALTHAAIDRSRVHRRRPERLAGGVPEGATDVDDAQGTVDNAWVITLLQTLPTQQRAVVCLRILEDMSVEDTARCLKISAGTVKSHLSRGLAQLRIALTSEEKSQ